MPHEPHRLHWRGLDTSGCYYAERVLFLSSSVGLDHVVEPGLVVDFTAEGQAIGIEITAPAKVSLAALNAVLKELGQAAATEADLAPVLAA